MIFKKLLCLTSLSLISLSFLSCEEDEEGKVSSADDKSEAKVARVETHVPLYLAIEKFDYADGVIKGNQPLKGFMGSWSKENTGEASVSNGVANIVAPTRLSCTLETSRDGVFQDFLDEQGFIGRDGTVIFLSYYQQLLQANPDQVNLLEVAKGSGHIHMSTQFNTGNDTDPGPVGPFGLRAKRDPALAIPAPEEINRRENLIVLRVKFGAGDFDEISYYYNPLPTDEDNPLDTVSTEDLSFDRVGIACFKGGAMRLRSIVLADNFKDAATERFAD